MKWLSSLLGRDKPNLPTAPAHVAEKSSSDVILCACCLENYSPEGTDGSETICSHCGADASLRLMMAVVRYSSRLMTNAGQTVLLIEPPAILLRQFDNIAGLRVVKADFADIVNSAYADSIETLDAAIMTHHVIGTPEECDAVQNIYGLLRRNGWLLMRGISGYFAEQAGFVVHENTAARIALLPAVAASGLNPCEKVLFCTKQSDAGRATKSTDKERAELRARFAPE